MFMEKCSILNIQILQLKTLLAALLMGSLMKNVYNIIFLLGSQG